jgi:uncharacterized protein YgbK (DUF1537 family)
MESHRLMSGRVLAASPRERIAAELRRTGTKVVVLDDDPTGSQTVAGVPVLLGWSDDDLRWGLSQPGNALFILTNSRSLDTVAAIELTRELAARCSRLAVGLELELRFVSRSDSTLRGHFPAEVEALDLGLQDAGHRPADGTILCPCYFEAGRVTIDDVHYVRAGERLIGVGETEFAADPVFGYSASNLREWVAERSGGSPAAIGHLTLEQLRTEPPSALGDTLAALPTGTVVIANATGYEDLDALVLGLLEAEAAGRRYIYRTAPSFVPVRAGLPVPPPLELGTDGVAGDGPGMVVVGSHTSLTTRQLAVAQEQHGWRMVEARVGELGDAAERRRVVHELRGELLAGRDAVLATTRAYAASASAAASLRLNAVISEFLVAATREVLSEAQPRFLVAKGGITSSVIATDALGAVRARVEGQLFTGKVSVWALELAGREAPLPYVVFPGNVGGDGALAAALTMLKGGRDA